MFNVTVENEDDKKFIPILEYTLNKEIYPKLRDARIIYGDNLINYLFATEQYNLIMDAMNGVLNEGNILMDQSTYDRIYGENRYV